MGVDAKIVEQYHRQRREVGANVLRIRSDLGLTADELAARVRVDRGTIIDVEQGDGDFELNLLVELAEALGTTAAELVKSRRPQLRVRL